MDKLEWQDWGWRWVCSDDRYAIWEKDRHWHAGDYEICFCEGLKYRAFYNGAKRQLKVGNYSTFEDAVKDCEDHFKGLNNG